VLITFLSALPASDKLIATSVFNSVLLAIYLGLHALSLSKHWDKVFLNRERDGSEKWNGTGLSMKARLWLKHSDPSLCATFIPPPGCTV